MSQLPEVAFGIFNNQDQAEEDERSWHENRRARAQAMTTAVSNALQPQDNPSGPRKLNHHLEVKPERGNASTVSQPAQKCEKEPSRPCLACKRTGHWRWDCPQSWRQVGSCSQRGHARQLRQPGDSGGSLREISNSNKKPKWSLTWQVRISIFKLVKETICPISHPGPLACKSCAVTGVDRKPHTGFLTGPLTCQSEQRLTLHAFYCVWVSYPTTGERPSGLPWGHIKVWTPWAAPFLDSKINQLEDQGPVPSHILHTVNPEVWDNGTPGKTINAQHVKISLKPEATYPNKRQYPIKLEAKTGLQPLIDKFLKHGLLTPCQSPRNTTILPVAKPNGDTELYVTLEQ